MRIPRFMAMVGCAALLGAAGAASGASGTLDPADAVAAYRAAGLTQIGKTWSVCPKGGKAEIDRAGDLNGDGRPDALIIERNVSCLDTESDVIVYRLLSKQADGSWALLMKGTGDVFLRPNKAGWGDLVVGDPTECRRVYTWKTDRFALDRGETDTGKTCILE